MARQKKKKKKNAQRKRRQITFGEVKKALDIERKAPHRLKRSPRLQRALSLGRELEAKLPVVLEDVGRAISGIVGSLSPEARRLFDALDSNPKAPWGEFTSEEVELMLKTMKPQRGAPERNATRERIRLAATLSLKGLTTKYQQAQHLFPNSRDPYKDTRTFYSRKRREIEQELQRLLALTPVRNTIPA